MGGPYHPLTVEAPPWLAAASLADAHSFIHTTRSRVIGPPPARMYPRLIFVCSSFYRLSAHPQTSPLSHSPWPSVGHPCSKLRSYTHLSNTLIIRSYPAYISHIPRSRPPTLVDNKYNAAQDTHRLRCRRRRRRGMVRPHLARPSCPGCTYPGLALTVAKTRRSTFPAYVASCRIGPRADSASHVPHARACTPARSVCPASSSYSESTT